MHKLILASESPRRKKILEDAHFSFEVFSVKVSENIEKNLTSECEINAEIQKIAKTKAQASYQHYPHPINGNYLFLSADTMVVFEGKPLGKPKSSTEAEEFLTQLSMQTHQVKTAVCLLDTNYHDGVWGPPIIHEFLETSEVKFRLILRQEILDYIATGEPMDKAGAYAIQGIGKKFVENFKGSYENIVGFPLEAFQSLVARHSFQFS